MYESSRTRHNVYLSCMSLCIIMLELFIRLLCFSVLLFVFLGLSLAFLAMIGCFSSQLLLLGKINSRMTRGGSNMQACEDVSVCRSARQVGHSPEP